MYASRMSGTRSSRTLTTLASVTLANALVTIALLTGCSVAVDGSGMVDEAARSGKSTPTGDLVLPVAATSPDNDTALAVLATLPVKGRAPMTGYDRDEFGTEWSDAAGNFSWSRNGCDSRNDALRRDLSPNAVIKPNTNDCVVTSGNYIEPYSGKAFHFIAGDSAMEHSIDIDHVVALGNVWTSGGWQWDEATRELVANDPLNLLSASASLNRSKSDANAAEWLPPSKAYRCEYVARQIAVKQKYALAVTDPERAMMEQVLASCPERLVPDAGEPVNIVKSATTQTPAPTPTEISSPTETSSPTATSTPTTGEVLYANCDEVRAAGAAPLYEGDPGYNLQLDGDADGDACE
jgi:hypothetical protein